MGTGRMQPKTQSANLRKCNTKRTKKKDKPCCKKGTMLLKKKIFFHNMMQYLLLSKNKPTLKLETNDSLYYEWLESSSIKQY